jgi:hypothetical protein
MSCMKEDSCVVTFSLPFISTGVSLMQFEYVKQSHLK